MLPLVTIDRARLADGTEFVLARRGDEWMVRAGPHLLMSSRSHESENELATKALARATSPTCVLVGGLGLGFTLRAVLDRVTPAARVVVSEMVPELVTWNKQHVGDLANHPLADPRCEVIVGDVFDTIQQASNSFDVILLDVDNGPVAVSHTKNKRLYTQHGIQACRRALRAGGVLAVWSAGPNPQFQHDLQRARLAVEVVRVPAFKTGKARHVIFLATAIARNSSVAPKSDA